jgi:hypothetical protein
MSRTSRAAFTLFCLVTTGIVPVASAARDQDPVIAIRIEKAGGMNAENLLSAQTLVTEIYGQAGVVLEWPVDQAPTAAPTLTVVLTTIATAPAGIVPEAMGVAPSPGDGTRGTTAYIFMDRVKSFVAAHRVVEEYVLACALAHEIGHLLLPPNAHAAGGIMRGDWHPALFPPKAPGVLGFSPDQARLLRLRAQSR